MVERDRILVIEVGGTTTRAARYLASTSTLVGTRELATVSPAECSATARLRSSLAAAGDLADLVMEGRQATCVGLAVAGPIDSQGRLLAAPTVTPGPDVHLFNLDAFCRTRWPGARSTIVNDLTAAGLALVARGATDFAVVTVGSGIGHKVFIDGVARVGRGRGGEIGHLRLDFAPDALPCDCGGAGHLGGMASGRGTVAVVRRHAKTAPRGYADSALGHLDPALLDGHAVATAFRAGDGFVRAAVSVSQGYLGQALAAIHLDTGIEDFVITGGFASGMGPEYITGLADAAERSSWRLGQDWRTMVRLADLGAEIGLLGIGAGAAGAQA